jgi:type I restriction enzyme M protein
VFNKGRTHTDVLFIDAKEGYEQGTNQNRLRPTDIEKIVASYRDNQTAEKYAYRATLEEIVENEFNCNIPRYVDTFEEEETVDLVAVQQEIDDLEKQLIEVRGEMKNYLSQLGITK